MPSSKETTDIKQDKVHNVPGINLIDTNFISRAVFYKIDNSLWVISSIFSLYYLVLVLIQKQWVS